MAEFKYEIVKTIIDKYIEKAQTKESA